MSHESVLCTSEINEKMYSESSKHDNLESILGDQSSKPHALPLTYLKDITNDFSDKRVIGKGGYGVVYKGVLQSGEIIAVKRLVPSMLLAEKQFENEVYHLMRLKHPNIVRFIGYCYETQKVCIKFNGKYVFAERQEMLLCLEYLSKGSLREYLSDLDGSSELDWHMCYKIIEGICYGLHYLHEQNDKSILHLDLKPANILLDDNMIPKIADFGISRLLDHQQTICTSDRAGTLGYMPPEYLQGGRITPKSDIFSLGVIIVELIAGHKDYPDVTDLQTTEGFIELELKKWRNKLERAQGYPSLEIVCQQIKGCIKIGLSCVNPERAQRPATTKIIEMLQMLEITDRNISNETTSATDQVASENEIPEQASVPLGVGCDYADARIALPGAPADADLRVHRCVLCTRSPFLSAFFARPNAGSGSNRVELRELLGDEVDIGYEALLLVLDYMYSGRVRGLPKSACICVDEDSCAHVGCRPAVSFMAQLLFIASTFQVPELTNHFQEKFADLRAKGCNLLGPQCIISCAKEHRFLPKQGYTCCLAMDGVKVLCSGFEKDEKARIEQLVTAMGGLLQTKVSMDVNFVITKDVLAAKYKWALNTLKKPIVSMKWLEQCWIEHRVVPHEPYRILPFTGLNICITKLNADLRKELAEIIKQNGGEYSANLTRKCTHLVANEPGGDKYIVAQKWGNIHIVDPRWIDQSVARRACLDENNYIVCQNSTKSNVARSSVNDQHNLEISSASASFRPVPATSVDDSVSTPQHAPAYSGDASKICSSDIIGAPSVQETNDMPVDSHVAEDSEAEDDDLYLSNCRISLVGFEEKELSRLVMMIRDGGGSRHVMLSERLTHIILGAPSEEEKKEVRRLAAWGVINVVKVTWLEDCNRAKKEVKVSATHLASDLLSKECPYVGMDKSGDARETKAAKSSCGFFHVPTVSDSHDKQLGKDLSSERKPARDKHEMMNNTRTASRSGKSSQQNGAVASISKEISSAVNSESKGSSNAFKGRTFWFSDSFSHERRAEVVDWIRKGGGIVVDDARPVVDFIIECHGQNNIHRDSSHSTVVSTHWIKSCWEVGYLQDVGNHPIFSPLPCRIPFPGFEDFRFCVSQYEEKDRVLLKNLCFILGIKFTEKATKKVTHLICQFASGPKYEAYHKRGIPTITVEWLFECVRQDKIVPFDQFQAKPPTSQERDAGLCTVSQYPTQAANTISRFDCSETLGESQLPRSSSKHSSGNASVNGEEIASAVSKRRRLSQTGEPNDTSGSIRRTEKHAESSSVPDVADEIEDLLVQSSMIQDMQVQPPSPRNTNALDSCTVNLSRDCHKISQRSSTPARSVQSSNSIPAPSPTIYYPFSETQTESQIVGYEEDLSGRQKIIDRVRSQSFNVTPSNEMPSAS